MLELGHKRSLQPAANWLEALSLATSAAPAAFFVECGMEVKERAGVAGNGQRRSSTELFSPSALTGNFQKWCRSLESPSA